MSMCAQFLTAARKVARERNGWTDRACAVLVSGQYHAVETYEGVIAWEGDAHCRYCARAEAIAYMAHPAHLADLQEKIKKYGRKVAS